ncbi:MAG: hypothetical protein F4Z77_10930 [Dehalococcoidia bacterium]|nr:hypothetical protein [Dehalococcoidia bacterium]MYA52441.1 hypothetical protein [Dehalococcoidia bacterium]
MCSRLLRLAAIALLVGLPSALRTETSLACSCIYFDPQEAYSFHDIVFVGKAVRAHHIPPEEIDDLGAQMVTKFEVSTVWKGPPYETLWVRSGAPGMCGFHFVEGQDYLVYAKDWHPHEWGNLITSSCSQTRELADGGDYLEALGEGQPPESGVVGPRPARLGDESMLPTWGIGLLVAGALAGAGVAILAVRRRARRT